MSSGQGFDHGSCVVLVSRVEGSLEFCECGGSGRVRMNLGGGGV